MNCAECKELLVGYVEGFLDESQKQTVAGHLTNCRFCRAELDAVKGLHKRLVTNGEVLAQTALENDVMNRIVREQSVRLKTINKISKAIRIRRIVMKSPIGKLAIAAAIIIAAVIGVHQFGGPIGGSSVAWGQVAENVRQIDTFMFSLSIKVAASPTEKVPQQVHAKWRIYLSEQYGFRMDIYANDKVVSWFVPAGSDTIITVIPDEKKWTKMPLSESQLQQEQQKDKDPREYINRFMSRPYKQLGRATIDGITVEGIEVNNPPTDGEPLENAMGRLWVDVATQLPVRIEIEGTAEGKPVQFIMDFRWSQAVDPSVFEPNIPSDYTAIK